MNQGKKISEEFEAVINRFSIFIKILIQRYDLPKKGVDPDDILQEVKIKIWKVLEDEKKINNFSSYIRKIVDSSVIDLLRKLKREENILNHERQKIVSEQKSRYRTEIKLDKNLKKMIAQAIDSLLESRRKVVKLFLLNMTIDEIAVLFNWSKDKTRNLLYRGLNDLKKILKEKGIEYENK